MSVYLISASINEKGTANGGKPGNQGNELKRRVYYNHSKGWVYLRPKSSIVADKIVYAAEAAYKNKHIGYCQEHRQTSYDELQKVGFDPAKLTKDVETDCSMLVRICCAYAGVILKNFTTPTQKQIMLDSGAFTEIHPIDSSYLCAGDILVTKTQGHTEIVVTNGAHGKREQNEIDNTSLIEEFKSKCKGAILSTKFVSRSMEEVSLLQAVLNYLGYDAGTVDGQFGDHTEIALAKFQSDHDMHTCGVFTSIDYEAMCNELDGIKHPAKLVHVVNGDCWLRTGPSSTYDKIMVLKQGTIMRYVDEYDEWFLVADRSTDKMGYMSKRYGEVKENG